MTPIDVYLASAPEQARQRLLQIRQVVLAEVPDGVETLSYAIPTVDLAGQHLVHFAGFAHHVGFYPTPSGMAAFDGELAAYKQGKGSVQFRHDQPLPLELVRQMVRARVAEVQALAASKRAKRAANGGSQT